MSSFFKWSRFLSLVRTHFAQSLRDYIWFYAIAIILYLVIALPMLIVDAAFEYEVQIVLFTIGLFLTGTVFAMRYFDMLSHKGSALSFFILPASIFEKFLLAFIIIVLLYPLVYTLIFEIITYPFVVLSDLTNQEKIARILEQTSNEIVRAPDVSYLQNKDFGHYIPFLSEPRALSDVSVSSHITAVDQAAERSQSLKWHWYFWSVLISIQGFAAMACIYFKRFFIIKALVSGFILVVVTCSILGISGIYTDNDRFFRETLTHIPQRDFLIAWQNIYLFIILIIIPILLWLSAFLYLKAREVS